MCNSAGHRPLTKGEGLMMYCYCYYCEKYCTVLGQATRCPDCKGEVASLSSCGMLHHEISERLIAEAKLRKLSEQTNNA